MGGLGNLLSNAGAIVGAYNTAEQNRLKLEEMKFKQAAERNEQAAEVLFGTSFLDALTGATNDTGPGTPATPPAGLAPEVPGASPLPPGVQAPSAPPPGASSAPASAAPPAPVRGPVGGNAGIPGATPLPPSVAAAPPPQAGATQPQAPISRLPQTPQAPQPQPRLTWSGIAASIKKTNPNATPEVIAATVNKYMPAMDAQAKYDWQVAQEQYRQAQVDETRRRDDIRDQHMREQERAAAAREEERIRNDRENNRLRQEEVSRRRDWSDPDQRPKGTTAPPLTEFQRDKMERDMTALDSQLSLLGEVHGKIGNIPTGVLAKYAALPFDKAATQMGFRQEDLPILNNQLHELYSQLMKSAKFKAQYQTQAALFDIGQPAIVLKNVLEDAARPLAAQYRQYEDQLSRGGSSPGGAAPDPFGIR